MPGNWIIVAGFALIPLITDTYNFTVKPESQQVGADTSDEATVKPVTGGYLRTIRKSTKHPDIENETNDLEQYMKTVLWEHVGMIPFSPL